MPAHKILHVIPSVGPNRGGPSVLIRTLARALSQAGLEIHVATTDDNGAERLSVPHGSPQAEDGATFWYFPRQTRFYLFSWPLTRWLIRNVRNFDVVHIHALFSYAALPAAMAARQAGVPYIVRPLGTLNRWGVKNRRPWLKLLSIRFIERRILASSAAVHFTSNQERIEASDVLPAARPEIIPNPLDIPMRSWSKGQFRARHPELCHRRMILFLSRFDEKKGLDLLLAAFAHVSRRCEDVTLVLAGDGPPALTNRLKKISHELGIESRILWAGFLTGDPKWEALIDADIFVLPSYSENFGIAVIEAMAAGVPVIVSDQVGIHDDVAAACAGAVVPCNVSRLAESLVRLLADAELRATQGTNGRRLVARHYSPRVIGARICSLYNEVTA